MNFGVVNLSSMIAETHVGPALRRRKRIDSRALIRAAAQRQMESGVAGTVTPAAMPTAPAANEPRRDAGQAA